MPRIILLTKRHLDFVSNDVEVHLQRNSVIITRFFFIGIATKKVKWCEEVGSSSFVASMSTRNQSILQDRVDAERTTSVIKILFPIVRNANISHQLRVNWYSSTMSLNCSKVGEGFCEILTILDCCLTF